METRRQGDALFAGILLLVGTVVIVQLWLVAASVESLLAHDFGILVPAAIGSFLCFVLNGLLTMYVIDFDKRVRRISPRQE
jgi:hypothetical protein